MSLNTKVRLVEMFKSIQGEGTYVGSPSLFVRLFGCNFTCSGFSNFDHTTNTVGDIPVVDLTHVTKIADLDGNSFTKGCDSRYAWHSDFKHLAKEYTAEELLHEIKRQLSDNAIDHIVWTGGEPLLNQKALFWLISQLPEYIHTIETNGSLSLLRSTKQILSNENFNIYNILFSVSPKLKNSGEPLARRLNPVAIQSYASLGAMTSPLFNSNIDITFKFVCASLQDINESRAMVKNLLSFNPDTTLGAEASGILLKIKRNIKDHFMIMPMGATVEQYNKIAPHIAELCIALGIKFSPRLHLNLFGNAVGT